MEMGQFRSPELVLKSHSNRSVFSGLGWALGWLNGLFGQVWYCRNMRCNFRSSMAAPVSWPSDRFNLLLKIDAR